MNPAQRDYEPEPERWTQTKDGRAVNISGLNRPKEPTGDPTDDHRDQYVPVPRSQKELPGWVRLRICERMLLEVTKYKHTLRKWIEHYSLYENHRNEPELRFVPKIKYRVLHYWYYTIATKPEKLQKLMDDVMAIPRAQRLSRSRFDVMARCRWGSCPFAERVVVEKRKYMVMHSNDHGYNWCTNEFNRIIQTPWMWTIARRYVTAKEGRRWASRGTSFKQQTRKMAVCTHKFTKSVFVGVQQCSSVFVSDDRYVSVYSLLLLLVCYIYKQLRHHWSTLKSSSDYKITVPQFIKARPHFWENERPFLKQLGVIRRKPDGYHESTHREVWDTDDWKVDGDLLLNFDEVPFSIDWSTKQLVAGGERIAMTQTALSRLKKYREGIYTYYNSVY